MNKRFVALDSFRGLCAISVAVYHMNVLGSFAEFNFFRGGSILVEFFFVLSGFVLAHSCTFKEDLNFKKFLVLRWFRLFPLHITMLVVFLLFEMVKLITYKKGFVFNSIPFTGSCAMSEIFPNFFLVQSWVLFADPLSFNYPSWSISVEFYVYVIFFFTLVNNRSVSFFVWLLFAVLGLCLLGSEGGFITYKAQRGISCFFAGCVTYYVFKKNENFRLSYRISSVIEILLVFLVFTIVSYDVVYRKYFAILVFCVSVMFYSFEFGIVSRFLRNKFLVKLGELSYSIYMVHAGVLYAFLALMLILQKITGLSLAPMVDGLRAVTLGNDIANNILVFFMLLVILFVSLLANKYIELPGRKIGRKLVADYKCFKK